MAEAPINMDQVFNMPPPKFPTPKEDEVVIPKSKGGQMPPLKMEAPSFEKEVSESSRVLSRPKQFVRGRSTSNANFFIFIREYDADGIAAKTHIIQNFTSYDKAALAASTISESFPDNFDILILEK